jgi:signal transduction histidine kinase
VADRVLQQFIHTHRTEIVARCRALISTRPVPRPTDAVAEFGVPLFLNQISERMLHSGDRDAISRAATQHGRELLESGFTIAQVVHDYGNVCQTVTKLAVELEAPITAHEFQELNMCLDEAIAAAVTEYGRLREHEGTERLGRLAHELRNVLNVAVLSFDMLKSGTVALGGSTSAVHARSLVGLRDLIDRELAEVRLGAGLLNKEIVLLSSFIEHVVVSAAMEATSRGVEFTVSPVPPGISVDVDRPLLTSAVSNLLQNAFKYTRPGGHTGLRVQASDDRVLIEVDDQCGGLPPGKSDELFRPFAQRGDDRSGLGLGLSIAHRGVQANGGTIRVVNRAPVGCVFIIDLPRHQQRSVR